GSKAASAKRWSWRSGRSRCSARWCSPSGAPWRRGPPPVTEAAGGTRRRPAALLPQAAGGATGKSAAIVRGRRSRVMGTWTLDDIRWERFERGKVDPEILRLVKAASLVERNGGDYAQYLCGVFRDDPAFQRVARQWGQEEIQHGHALGRWAELADPAFDHAAACARFTAGFRVDLDAERSVRGTRSGEL